MHALLFQAFIGDARAADFREAINIQRVDVEQRFQPLAHGFRPGLRAKGARPQLQRRQRDAHFMDGFRDMDRVGGRAAQNGRAHVLHHHDLFGRVAARHGDDHRAQLRRALVRAHAAGEQAVSIRHLHDIVRRGVGRADRARHHFRPILQIVPRVARQNRLARRSRRPLQTHDFPARHGKQPGGIFVAQIRLLHKGQILQIVQRANVFRLNALFVHAAAIQRHIVVFAAHDVLQALQLKRAQLLSRHAFGRRVPDAMGCHGLYSSCKSYRL